MKSGKNAKRGDPVLQSPPASYLAPWPELFPPAVVKRALLVIAGLIVAIIFIYAPVRNFDFVNLDDPEYVPGNPRVNTGLTLDNVRWSLTSGYAANWFPLTWISHMLDVEIFGVDSGWHHVTNVMLHTGSATLLFLLLFAMTGAIWPSAFVAALFAVHPMRVESVAWVAERKDVLSTFLWMLTLAAYLAYLRRPGKARFAAMLLIFALGLMSKPMLVTLPFVLLLLDIWPLKRVSLDGRLDVAKLRLLILEKLPMFAVVVASSIITYIVQSRGGSVSMTADFPMTMRIANALVAYVRYIGKMLWPANLAAFYPFNEAIPAWQVIGAAVLLLGVSAAAFARIKRQPHVFVGWFLYLGTLVPVIGLIKIGSHSIADRYTYIPHVGLFLLIAWSASSLAESWHVPKAVLAGAAAAVLMTFTFLSRAQAATWKDSITLWTHAATVIENNAEAHSYLGTLLAEQGQMAAANAHFEEALRMNPRLVHAHGHFGATLLQQGRVDQAIEHLREARRLNPNVSDVEGNLGVALAAKGNFQEAVGHYQRALEIDPAYADAYTNWGIALANRGDLPAAIEKFRTAVRLKPDSAEAHNNLGAALARSGAVGEAIGELMEALRLKPDQPDWLVNVAVLLARQNDVTGARSYAGRALQLAPNHARARQLLASLDGTATP